MHNFLENKEELNQAGLEVVLVQELNTAVTTWPLENLMECQEIFSNI